MGVRGGHSGVGDLRSSARRDGNICVLCMIWRPRTGLGALPGKNFTQCIPKQRFAGFLDTPHANLAKTSSFWIHIGYMLPRRGVFSVLGPFWNTSSENLATVRRLGTYFANILPRLDDGKALGEYLAIVDQWRTHLGGDLAIVDQWRMRHEGIFPSLNTSGCALAEYSGSHRRTLRDLP